MDLNVVHLKGCSIFQQLQFEEALLRADSQNWCLLNHAVPPAIVMGISGKADELICPEKMRKQPIPIIRRYSGGGTVYVDSGTAFISFIIQNQHLNAPSYPTYIHAWAKTFYSKVFDWDEFNLIENDYVLGQHKFGGNAQYISKHRIVHHTSFLWDFDEEAMEYLLMPKKIPDYRLKRMHKDFLCRLSDRIDSVATWEKMVTKVLHEQFLVKECAVSDLVDITQRTHRRATCYVDFPSSQSLIS